MHRFLLARFNVDDILQFGTVTLIERALSNFSTSKGENERRMDEIYDRIISSIRKKHPSIQNYAYRALSWIGYAARTLTVQELLVAISVEANQYHLDDSNVVGFKDLLDYCNGLLTSDGELVRLVHLSLRNYLDRHHVIPEDAKEMYRAIACSTYLSLDILKECPCDTSFGNSFPFLDYAANNLAFHLSKVKPEHYPETTRAVLKLLEGQGHRRVYCKINIKIGKPHDIPRLNLACAIGYEDAVKTLLKEGEVDINEKGPRDGLTSLSWAMVMRHEEVVKRLFGEDKLDWNCNGIMPLLLAMESRGKGMIPLFPEKGIEANFTFGEVSQSGYGKTQLYRY